MGYRGRYEWKLCVALDDSMVEVRAANGKIYNNYANVIWVWARNCQVETPQVNLVGMEKACTDKAQSAVNVVKRDFVNQNLKRAA